MDAKLTKEQREKAKKDYELEQQKLKEAQERKDQAVKDLQVNNQNIGALAATSQPTPSPQWLPHRAAQANTSGSNACAGSDASSGSTPGYPAPTPQVPNVTPPSPSHHLHSDGRGLRAGHCG